MEIISEESEGYESSNQPRENVFSKTNAKEVNRISGFTSKTLNLTLDTFRRSLRGKRKTLRKQISRDSNIITGKRNKGPEFVSVVNLELNGIKSESRQEGNKDKFTTYNKASENRTLVQNQSSQGKGYGSALDFVVHLIKKRVKMRRYFEEDDEASLHAKSLKRSVFHIYTMSYI